MAEKVWVTKYALTSGIVRVSADVDGKYAYGTDQYRTQYPPGTWHRDWSDAVKAARLMRDRKIASVKKQLARLEAMTFAREGKE